MKLPFKNGPVEDSIFNESGREDAMKKELSGIIFERVGDEKSFGRSRSKGDQALLAGVQRNR